MEEVENIFLKNRNSGYIFEYKKNRKNMVSYMSKKFKKIEPNYTPYLFRHTFASQLSDKSVDETHINFLLGKLPSGTLKNYLKNGIDILFNDMLKLRRNFDFYNQISKIPIIDLSQKII